MAAAASLNSKGRSVASEKSTNAANKRDTTRTAASTARVRRPGRRGRAKTGNVLGSDESSADEVVVDVDGKRRKKIGEGRSDDEASTRWVMNDYCRR